MRFFFTMFYNCTKFQNNPRGSVEKHQKICWIDMEWPYCIICSIFGNVSVIGIYTKSTFAQSTMGTIHWNSNVICCEN